MTEANLVLVPGACEIVGPHPPGARASRRRAFGGSCHGCAREARSGQGTGSGQLQRGLIGRYGSPRPDRLPTSCRSGPTPIVSLQPASGSKRVRRPIVGRGHCLPLLIPRNHGAHSVHPAGRRPLLHLAPLFPACASAIDESAQQRGLAQSARAIDCDRLPLTGTPARQ